MKDYLKIGVIVIIGIAFIAVVGAVIDRTLIRDNQDNQEQNNVGAVVFTDTATDVIGTKTGTSTVGVDFSVTATGGQSATSTYRTKINHSWDTAIYSFKAVEASSTANMHFSFLGSNDTDCDSASTTTSISDIVLTGDVNWFDVGSHVRDITYSASLGTGTTTLIWDNPVVYSGKTVILNDLSYKCLRLDVSGSSTQAYVQITGK